MTAALKDVLDGLLDDALQYSGNVVERPVVLLWPDKHLEFAELAGTLATHRPVIRLGDYDPNERHGPAYWLRCVVAGAFEVDMPDGIPVLYLPGVGREDLRAIEQCPRHLAPLAELQYRGAWFAHPNGRDWTIRTLLTNTEQGLGLTVKDDQETLDALVDAFPKLLTVPIHQLRANIISAQYLQELLTPDLHGSLLAWLDGPSGFKTRIEDSQWKAFVAQAKEMLGFNPDKDGELTGARLLGEAAGTWQDVWDRYAAEPEKYPGIEERLRTAKPTDTLFDQAATGRWPQDNADAETALQKALTALAGTTAKQARDALNHLWADHRARQGWVWATLDRAPLAFALEHLQHLASLTEKYATGDVAELAADYADNGWKADRAFLDALAAVPAGDERDAVTIAGLALYQPWLDAHATALQEAVAATPGSYAAGPQASTTSGTVTLFIDGFRLDLAHRLAALLGQLDVQVDTSLAALPTVTQTAKPALVPMADGALVAGGGLGPAKATGAAAGIAVWRSLMEIEGVQVLSGAETGDPGGSAWAEAGSIDERGHKFGAQLVDELDSDLRSIARHVQRLLDAGWTQVDVVTDHGWVMLPGGLPKVELPVAVTDMKKGRCARLKPGADVEVTTVGWHWDSDVRIAVAPGISCFESGKEYEHGGISPQECVVPRMHVRMAAERPSTSGASITAIRWSGLRCRIQYEQVAPGATVDLRTEPGEASSSVALDPRDTMTTGQASLLVPDEDLEGDAAYVVVIASDGTILAQRQTTIGRNG